MRLLYVIILQSFCNSACFERPFRSSSGVHKSTVSAALHKPCKRASWGLGEALTAPPREKTKCYEILTGEMLPVETAQSGGKILPH